MVNYSRRRLIFIGFLSWLSMLAVDFFLHGGLLAGLYVKPSPFLLPPAELFRLIPLGYLAALLSTVLLLWLMLRLGLSGWRRGLTFGLQLGALIGGAGALGLLSASTAGLDWLVGLFVAQTMQMGIAGGVAGSGLGGTRLRALLVTVVVLVFLLVAVTIALQSLGLAPAVRLGA